MIGWSLRWGLVIGCLFAGAYYFLSADTGTIAGRVAAWSGDPHPASASPRKAPPVRAQQDFGSEMRVKAGPDGHYYVDVAVNSTPVRFLVDTGATAILLSSSDASRIGLHPAPSDYTSIGRTANGVIKLAPVNVREMRLGGFTAHDVETLVSQAPSDMSLLGMTFLNRLNGWEVRGRELFLRW